MKLEPGTTVVIATHNKGKIPEIADLLAPFKLNIKNAAELGLPEPDETGETYIENALIKARSAATASGLVAIADDSGLAVAALNGAPGLYSARWATGKPKDFYTAMARVERELKEKGATDYSAKFVCALALVNPDGEYLARQGEVHGHLEFPPRGKNGFGYDPIFVMNGMTSTYGEIPQSLKDTVNHRAIAFAELQKAFSSV